MKTLILILALTTTSIYADNIDKKKVEKKYNEKVDRWRELINTRPLDFELIYLQGYMEALQYIETIIQN